MEYIGYAVNREAYNRGKVFLQEGISKTRGPERDLRSLSEGKGPTQVLRGT